MMHTRFKKKKTLFIILSTIITITVFSIIVYANNITLTTYLKTRTEPKYTCNITYDANGGIGHHTSTAILHGEMDTVQALEDMGIKHSNYIFSSWNTQKDGGGTTYQVGDRIILNSDVTLFAQWQTNR